MRIALIDDEKRVRDQLSLYLEKFAVEHKMQMEIEAFSSAVLLLKDYDHSFDIIFMDIEMDDMDGISASREIRKRDERVILIFVTNMAQYAIQGYEVNAMDFVVKPVSYEDFAFRLQKAVRYAARDRDACITVGTADRIKVLAVEKIYYVEVMLHYLVYHTADGEYKVRGTMKEAVRCLEAFPFSRCNNCYLVNLKHVEAVEGADIFVKGNKLPMSRNRKAAFMQEFTRYMGGFR